MSEQPPDDRKILEDLEKAPTHCNEGSDEMSVSEDLNKDNCLRYIRLIEEAVMSMQPPDDRKILEDLGQAPTHCNEGSDEMSVSEDLNKDNCLRYIRLIEEAVMSMQPPDDRKFLSEDLEQAPTHCNEGSDEMSVSEDPKRDIRLRYTRHLRRGPSAWRYIGALLDHQGQGYTDDIFKTDQMMTALMISEATDRNGVGLPLMTLVNSNVKFDGGYIGTDDKYGKDTNKTLTVDPEELESAQSELRSGCKAYEKEKIKRIRKRIGRSTTAADQPCDEVAEKELNSLVEKQIKRATSKIRRRVDPLLSADLIKVVRLKGGEKIAYQSTWRLREALDSMMTGKWAFETEDKKS